uniref:Uncharacterized protein n=1 Tax=Arundo donax TaxID=35708 RepID=A0A0A8YA92_ARUDO
MNDTSCSMSRLTGLPSLPRPMSSNGNGRFR